MKWNLVEVSKETDHRFLNFYVLHYEVGDAARERAYTYFLASRREKGALLCETTDFSRPDGVIMVLFAKGQDGQKRLLLNRQFRPAINEYVYSLPAGLMDEGDESIGETARREAREEAGAILGEVSLLVRPSPTSEGLSDELDCIVMADVIGIDKTHREAFEDIASNALSKEEFASLLDDEEAIIPLPLRALALYLLETWESKTDTGIA